MNNGGIFPVTNPECSLCGYAVAIPLNHKVITEDAKKDGFFGIIAKIKEMTANDIVSNCKELWRIEDAFGEMKATLKSRPMFHLTDQLIIGHIMLCLLSNLCEAHHTKRLSKSGLMQCLKATENGIIKECPLTVKSAMVELNQFKTHPATIKKETIWLRTDTPPNAIKLIKQSECRYRLKYYLKTIKCSGTNPI